MATPRSSSSEGRGSGENSGSAGEGSGSSKVASGDGELRTASHSDLGPLEAAITAATRQSPADDRQDACRRCCCLSCIFSGHRCIAVRLVCTDLVMRVVCGHCGGRGCQGRCCLDGAWRATGWPTRLRRGRDVVRSGHTLPRRWACGEAGGALGTSSSEIVYPRMACPAGAMSHAREVAVGGARQLENVNIVRTDR